MSEQEPKLLLIPERLVSLVLQYMQELSIPELSIPKVSVGEVQMMMQKLMRLQEVKEPTMLPHTGLSEKTEQKIREAARRESLLQVAADRPTSADDRD